MLRRRSCESREPRLQLQGKQPKKFAESAAGALFFCRLRRLRLTCWTMSSETRGSVMGLQQLSVVILCLQLFQGASVGPFDPDPRMPPTVEPTRRLLDLSTARRSRLQPAQSHLRAQGMQPSSRPSLLLQFRLQVKHAARWSSAMSRCSRRTPSSRACWLGLKLQAPRARPWKCCGLRRSRGLKVTM